MVQFSQLQKYQRIREVFKTGWKLEINLPTDKTYFTCGFICQSQSLNLFVDKPDLENYQVSFLFIKKRIKMVFII